LARNVDRPSVAIYGFLSPIDATRRNTMSGSFWILFWWLAFGATHTMLSSLRLRPRFIARLGARGFLGVYSLVAFATFIPLVWVYFGSKHSGPLLWNLAAVPGVRPLAIALSALAVVLLVLAFAQPSPLGLVPGVPRRARGVTRITRHALFMAITLWGLAHLLVNGFLSDVLFFGGFVAYGLYGSHHQDIRKRADGGPELAAFYAETSLLPFGAILNGRNRLVASEIPVAGLALGVVAAALLYIFHERLFG
jgi:uncharacterized membrane protein